MSRPSEQRHTGRSHPMFVCGARVCNARPFRNTRPANAPVLVARKRYTQDPASLRQVQDFFGFEMSGIAHLGGEFLLETE